MTLRAALRPSVLFAVAALIPSCADAPPDGPAGSILSVRRDTVGGVVHVRHSGSPPRLVPRLVVELGEGGTVGDPGPGEFGRVTSVVLDSGRILVADALAHEIRVFDLGGSFLETWGREGEGPGEFGTIYSLGWLGDTLAVLDPRVGRIGLFGAGGDWAGQWPYPGGVSGPPSYLRFYPVGPRELYVLSLRSTRSGIESHWAGVGPEGETASLPFVDAGPEGASVVECPRPDGAITFFTVPFAPALLQTPGPGSRLALAWSADYRIALVTGEGDTSRVIEREHEAAPVSAAEWREATADYRSFQEEWPEVRCSPDMPDPLAVKPAIAKLYHDRAGRLWVEVFALEGRRFDIYDGDGTLVAELSAPPYGERAAPFLEEGRIAVVAADSLGVDRVRVYEIER